MTFERIIFLCRDNASLSPMAESIFISAYGGTPVYVASRGMVVLYEAPLNPKIETVLANHELRPVRQTTMEIKKEELTGVTLVVAMTSEMRSLFKKTYPNIACYSLHTLAGEEKDLKNPYGGSLMDYEECYNDIVRMIRKAIPTLEEMNQGNAQSEHLAGLFENEGSIV